MNRFFQTTVLVLCLLNSPGIAQFARSWNKTPAINVVYSKADDRLDLVDEAVVFWNKTFEEIGSGFRLPKPIRVKNEIPETALQSLSSSIVGGPGPGVVADMFAQLPADMNIYLGETEFVSFAGPFDKTGKRVVGIRGTKSPPLNMPNVARNVIIHEIGHAIGLGHNSDPAMLMCGRPAPCRPALFAAPQAKIFALTDAEKRQLLQMYPPDWKSKK